MYYQKSHKKQRSFQENLEKYLKKIPFIGNINFTREVQLMTLFFFLFLIIIIRLFYLQVIQYSFYDATLSVQHTRSTSVKANRGDIYAVDKTWQPVKLTENLSLYDIALDPKLVGVTTGGVSLKPRLIELLTPVVYKHLCIINGMDLVTPEGCVKNVEYFVGAEILPKMPELFYYGSGMMSPEYTTFDFTGFEERRIQIISGFTEERAKDLIAERLEKKIQIGIKDKNYVGFFTNEEFLTALAEQNFPFISILGEYYVYVVPTRSSNSARDKNQLQILFNKYGYSLTASELNKLFSIQEYRYIKLFTAANPQIAQDIKQLKELHYNEKSDKKVPVLHGVILEPYNIRYYPRGEFMSNIIGYVDKNWDPYYGIEKYFDETLKGIDGKIKGRASSWIGTVGANDFEVIDAKDGDDVYLTIDIGIQKEVESIAQQYLEQFRADAISVMVYDPNNGQVKASVNVPTFNPNNYNDAYILQPLGQEHSYIVDDLTYVDVPVYVMSWGKYKLATISERQDITLAKYLPKNVYGSQVFVDKNISTPFEPGSIFKAFTMAIGLDTDEIRLYDYYQDDGQVKVWPYTIKNATTACLGNNTFLRGFINSCNVGMVRVVQRVGKEIFYNYLSKFWFGKLTGIELAEEKQGFVDNETTVSAARFLNNSFWQGLQTTQIQLAAAYGALVNGGRYIKPTIISWISKKSTDLGPSEFIESNPQVLSQIIRPEVSAEIKQALLQVLEQNEEVGANAKIPGYLIGAKSWTSQIAFRGKYQRGNGRTQGTFVGMVTVDNPQYVVLVWTSRPRTNQWWGRTSGKVFRDVARFLIGYSLIE